MRLDFDTKRKAQDVADRIHASMIATNADYARSVAAGQTTAWAKPYQDVDDEGVPLNATWWINLKARSRPTLTTTERTALKPYRTR